MIEIIKYPKHRERIQFLCKHCRAEWLAEYADYKINDLIESVLVLETKCPCCGYLLAYTNKEDGNFWNYFDEPEQAGTFEIQHLPGKGYYNN